MRSSNRKSSSVIGFVTRHRVAVAMLLVFLIAQPATPDDRQLLRATAGANTNVLLILDSSHSMTADFSDRFNLPAYMDDFLYPQGTFTVVGSKIGVAKSVLRQVLTTASGVNWSFAYYRNPNQTFGAAQTVPGTGVAVGGARTAGQLLENGGLEWLYFVEDDVSSFFNADEYPDIQQGRFLQFGHKVPRPYVRYGVPPTASGAEVADIRPPYVAPVGVSSGPPGEPFSGEFRGAFGPKAFDSALGTGQGMVVYRNPSKPGFELHLKVLAGNYGDPFIDVEVQEWSPPPTSTP